MDPTLLQKGLAYIESRGYRIKKAAHLSDRHGYLAGLDQHRAEDVNAMFTDPEVHAILCTRGGYGIQRILASLDYDGFKTAPKILTGFSDITALQLALFSETEVVTFSGPMAAVEMGKGIHPFTETSFWSMITTVGEKHFEALEGPLTCLKSGSCQGRLLGGCLSLVVSVVGTKFEPDWRGAILFLEDVGEEPYQIDRKLMHLKQAGVFEKVAGLVFGDFESCLPENPEKSLTVQEAIKEIIQDLTIPVAAGLPYGHIDIKYTIPIGVNAFLDSTNGYLELTESPVV